MLGVLIADCEGLVEEEILQDLSVFVNERNMLQHDLHFKEMQDPCKLIKIHNKIVKYFKKKKNIIHHVQSKNIIEINWNCKSVKCFWCNIKQFQEQLLLEKIREINSYTQNYLLQVIVQNKNKIKYVDKMITLAGFDCISVQQTTIHTEKQIILRKFFSRTVPILVSDVEVFCDELVTYTMHTIIYYDI